jgi:hypothetical protein
MNGFWLLQPPRSGGRIKGRRDACAHDSSSWSDGRVKRCPSRTTVVPDESTAEAISDWHYWRWPLRRGHFGTFDAEVVSRILKGAFLSC